MQQQESEKADYDEFEKEMRAMIEKQDRALREQLVTMMILAGQARRSKARELKAHTKLIAQAEASSARLQRMHKDKSYFTYYAMRLQEVFRLRMAKRQMAATKLQETYQAQRERRHFSAKKRSVVKLQARVRGVLIRHKFLQAIEDKSRLQRQAAYARRTVY